MRTKLTIAKAGIARLLTATFGLAMALTFSCSNDDGNNDPFAGIPEWEEYKEFFKYYDPDDEMQRCRNGAVEGRCEVDGKEVWYSPLTHACHYYSGSCDGGYGEDGYSYSCEPTTYEFGTIERCGNEIYISGYGRCKGGVLEEKCGNAWYNRETHYCDDSRTGTVKAKERCGSKYYYPSEGYTRCRNGVIEEKCGYGENEIWYNPETHYCSYDDYTIKAIERCGNKYINDDYMRCNNGVVEEKCGNAWYNWITQSCDWNTSTVKNKLLCGN